MVAFYISNNVKVFVSNKASFWNFIWHTFTHPMSWRGLQFQSQCDNLLSTRQLVLCDMISCLPCTIFGQTFMETNRLHGTEMESLRSSIQKITNESELNVPKMSLDATRSFAASVAPFSNHSLFLPAVFTGALVITTWLLRCQNHLQTDTSGYGNCSGLPNCIGSDRQTRSGRFDGNNGHYAMHEF